MRRSGERERKRWLALLEVVGRSSPALGIEKGTERSAPITAVRVYGGPGVLMESRL